MSNLIVCATIAYVLGSFPSGYLAGRIGGVDVRRFGSGNVGATNVFRVLGKPFGYCVFAADFIKGLAAVLLARAITGRSAPSVPTAELATTVAGICAVLGHSFPIWLKFRGGKGVATSLGVLFGLVPIAATIVCLVWVITFQLGRYVSLASLAAAVTLPICVGAMLFVHWLSSPLFFYLSIALAFVMVVRHRSNLLRLINGTEPRFEKK